MKWCQPPRRAHNDLGKWFAPHGTETAPGDCHTVIIFGYKVSGTQQQPLTGPERAGLCGKPLQVTEVTETMFERNQYENPADGGKIDNGNEKIALGQEEDCHADDRDYCANNSTLAYLFMVDNYHEGYDQYRGGSHNSGRYAVRYVLYGNQ